LNAVVNRDELVLFEDSLNNLPGATWTPPAGMSTRATASALLVNSAVADQTVGGRGVTGTRTATMSSIGQLAGVAILLRRDDGTQYLLHDQQGSTRLITDRLGHVVGGYTYTPYGATISHTGTATSSLRYDGQYQDDETGLYYLQARYYNPTLGQFLTVDPLVNTTGQPYAYALGSPLMGGDPTGLGCGITSFSSLGDCLKDFGTGVETEVDGIALGAEDFANWAKTHFGTLAQLGAGVVCIAAAAACVVAVLAATTLKIDQDELDHSGGGQIAIDGIVGIFGAGFSGIAAEAVAGLEDGSVVGLNQLIESAVANGEDPSTYVHLRTFFNALGFAPAVADAIFDSIASGDFKGICVGT
jgi:RHS repeat-associated protein